MSGFLQPVYLSHFCLLVKAIYLVSSKRVSSNDVLIAEMCLAEFVKDFPNLYSLRYLSMNVHQLLQLAQSREFLLHCL